MKLSSRPVARASASSPFPGGPGPSRLDAALVDRGLRHNDWVTIDAATSNDLFFFDHNPMRLDNLKISAPDGTAVKAENASGEFRSTFDVPLNEPGTYLCGHARSHGQVGIARGERP